jgi:hypothetical protein
MSDNPMGLHGLLQGYSFTFLPLHSFTYLSTEVNCKNDSDEMKKSVYSWHVDICMALGNA